MKNYSLYWIYDKDKHSDPKLEGYIGVTKRDPKIRLTEHLTERQWIKERNYDLKILYSDLTESEALDLEIEYRPEEYIGWNKAKGGQAGNRPFGIHTSGWTHSEEAKQERSKIAKNNSWKDNFGIENESTEKRRERIEAMKGVPKPGTSVAMKQKFKDRPELNPFYGKSGALSPTAAKVVIDDTTEFSCWADAKRELNKSKFLILKEHSVKTWTKSKGWMQVTLEGAFPMTE